MSGVYAQHCPNLALLKAAQVQVDIVAKIYNWMAERDLSCSDTPQLDAPSTVLSGEYAASELL